MAEKNKRIELHCHSKLGSNSAMYPGEIIRYLSETGMPAFAITDDSNINAFPEIESVSEFKEYMARPIYGMEIWAEGMNTGEVDHMSLLIRNEVGKETLYRILSDQNSTEAHPIFSFNKFLEEREGFLIGSGTEQGRLYKLVHAGKEDEELKKEMAQYDYIELLPGSRHQDVNIKLISLCDELQIPAVAISDARYLDKYGKKSLMIMQHWDEDKTDYLDNELLSTEKMLEEFGYLTEAKAYEIVVENTHMIADMCKSIAVCPKERRYPELSGAGDRIRSLCMASLEDKYTDCKDEVLKRLEWELLALKKTGMESCLLQLKELLEISELTASEISTRGTGASSIVAFLLGITEIDPMSYNLAPEMVYSCKQNRTIDIDLNIPTNMQSKVHKNFEKVSGVSKVVYGGTFQSVSDSMAECMIEKYEMDHEQFFEEEIRNKLKWCISGNYVARRKHPGGLVVFPDSCDYLKMTPLSKLVDGSESTYFDYHSVDSTFIKYDLLSHKSLEILVKLSKKTGVALSSVPVDDEAVLKLFNADEDGQVTGCADLYEFETEYVRKVVALLKPDNFDELVKIISLLHGTGTWEDVGEKLVKENNLGIKDIIANRDDVFDYNLSLGLDREIAFEIADAVRKGIVSRGRNAKWQAWKKILREAGAPEWYIWSCEQIKYLFPRSHAISYMFMTMRMGWFKVHYPVEYNAVMKDYDGMGL